MYKHLTQVLFAKAKIMAKLVPLVLQGVEGLILYLPPGPGTTHELVHIVRCYGQIGYPAEAQRLLSLGIILPILDKGDPDVLVALIERSMVDNAETVGYLLFLCIGKSKRHINYPAPR